MRRRKLVGVVSLFALLVGACASQAPTETVDPATSAAPGATSATASPGSPDESATAAPSSTDSGSPAALLEVGPGEFDMLDLTAGLDDLAAYRAQLTATFEGTRAGAPHSWSVTWERLHAEEPPVDQYTREAGGDEPPVIPVHSWQVGVVAYVLNGEQCTANVVAPETSFAAGLEPAASLLGVLGADQAGRETVNGVDADHYTFDERALGLAGVTSSTGELWVAADGGSYVVRYVLTSEGGADYFGEGIEGTITWDYQLTDVNGAPAIVLPADCPPGLIEAPRPSDAVVALDMPGVLEYDTAADMAEVLDFYGDRAADEGWTTIDGPITSNEAGLISYADGQFTTSVFVQPRDGGSRVIVTLEVTSP